MGFDEINLYLEGYRDKEDKELNKLRAIGYWVLSPWSKKLKKPQDLFKIDSVDNQQFNNKEVNKEHLLEFAGRFQQDLKGKPWKIVKSGELKQ